MRPIVGHALEEGVFHRRGRVEADVALIETERTIDRIHHVADANDAGERNGIQIRGHSRHHKATHGLAVMIVASETRRPRSRHPRRHSPPLESARVRRGRATSPRRSAAALRGGALGAVVDERAAVAVSSSPIARATPEAFAALHGALTGRNPTWAGSAPVLALVAVRKTFEATRRGATRARGTTPARLSRCSWCKPPPWISPCARWRASTASARARALGIPAPFEPAVAMAIGYAGDPDVALGREASGRRDASRASRKALGEIVFEGAWDRPLVK